MKKIFILLALLSLNSFAHASDGEKLVPFTNDFVAHTKELTPSENEVDMYPRIVGIEIENKLIVFSTKFDGPTGGNQNTGFACPTKEFAPNEPSNVSSISYVNENGQRVDEPLSSDTIKNQVLAGLKKKKANRGRTSLNRYKQARVQVENLDGAICKIRVN